MVECYECFKIVPFEESYPIICANNNLRVCSIACLEKHAEITRANTRNRLAGRVVELRSTLWQANRWGSEYAVTKAIREEAK